MQKQHEQAVVAGFLNYYNQINGTQFAVDSEPEPPEAIAKDGEKCIWLEVTDVYFSDDLAKDVQSYATPGETHIPEKGGVKESPDKTFLQRFMGVVETKLSKPSYKEVCEIYGPGILIVGIQYPLFNEEMLHELQVYQKSMSLAGNLGYFNKIYIKDTVDIQGLPFLLWKTF